MTLLAAFTTLLGRYSGQDDVVVGSPIAGRTHPEMEGLIGFFANTLVLRTNLSGNPSFRALLRRMRETALAAYAHQDLPFEKLVEELQPERSLRRNPHTEVMFNFHSMPEPVLELSGMRVTIQELAEVPAQCAMTLHAKEHAGELGLELVYQRALFSGERMRGLLQQFRHLLEQLTAVPEAPIRSYSLVTPESRHVLPDPTALLPEPRQELVTNRFAHWARRLPRHPAVTQGQQTWSYRQLSEAAEALARALVARGLERGEVVALSGPRSFGLIAGMMGILQGGGVLLPIDPTFPTPRKQLMVREAAAKKFVEVRTRAPTASWFEDSAGVVRLGVEADTAQRADWKNEPQARAVELPEVSTEDPAYIFFTSGTTGVPKGILGCHKGLSHFLHWQRETFAVGPRDRSAQLTSPSFDVVLRDVFLPLTSGSTLCLPEDVDGVGPADLVRWLERERISILHTVPALAQFWLDNAPPEVSLPELRLVFFAGEPLTDTLVRRWQTAFAGGAEIINLYGPTETTLAKCFYRVPAEPLPGVQAVGEPLPETQALVVAENSQLCGVGELGEIVLRTPFRSLGYVNVPEPNGFVRNPFRTALADWLYRTGDLGRYRLDGTLEILGRRDDQVKIRGVRVEPCEVAATLARHPAVQTCTVIPAADQRQETQLVAYVVTATPQRVTPSELRAYLGDHLPSALVPSVFVFLDKLPLMPNGKVDRWALPAPKDDRPELDESYLAPRTPVEERLAALWAEAFGVNRVGIHDNFFALGGHSLLAIRVMSRVRKSFGVELPLRAVFEAPTVAGLAVAIVEHLLAQAEPTALAGLLRESERRSGDEIEP
jgi:amino acid adenylation domain-containing protein